VRGLREDHWWPYTKLLISINSPVFVLTQHVTGKRRGQTSGRGRVKSEAWRPLSDDGSWRHTSLWRHLIRRHSIFGRPSRSAQCRNGRGWWGWGRRMHAAAAAAAELIENWLQLIGLLRSVERQDVWSALIWHRIIRNSTEYDRSIGTSPLRTNTTPLYRSVEDRVTSYVSSKSRDENDDGQAITWLGTASPSVISNVVLSCLQNDDPYFNCSQ